MFCFFGVNALSSVQLFRRVAAALPGMESLDDANPEGSILKEPLWLTLLAPK